MKKASEVATGADKAAAMRLADECETAEYVAELLTQLERIARGHGLVRLQYLLRECRDEAQRVAVGAQTPVSRSRAGARK